LAILFKPYSAFLVAFANLIIYGIYSAISSSAYLEANPRALISFCATSIKAS